MNEATTIRVGGSERAAQGRRLRARHLWLVPGLAIAIVANELGKSNGVGILLLIAFGLLPDLPRLFGIGRHRSGGVQGIALEVFNVLHHPVTPVAAVALAAVAGTIGLPAIWLVATLIWLSHVVFGLAVGDVRRPRPREAAHA